MKLIEVAQPDPFEPLPETIPDGYDLEELETYVRRQFDIYDNFVVHLENRLGKYIKAGLAMYGKDSPGPDWTCFPNGGLSVKTSEPNLVKLGKTYDQAVILMRKYDDELDQVKKQIKAQEEEPNEYDYDDDRYRRNSYNW